MSFIGKGFINSRYQIPGKTGQDAIPHPDVKRSDSKAEFATFLADALADQIVTTISQRRGAVTLDRLARKLNVSPEHIAPILDVLVEVNELEQSVVSGITHYEIP